MVCFILVMRNGLCDQLGKTHKSILLRETFLQFFSWGGGVGGGGGGGGSLTQAEKLLEKSCEERRIL